MSSEQLIRHRRNNIREFIENVDAFNKATDEVLEAKKARGGIISGISFTLIAVLSVMQIYSYLFNDDEFDYKFSMDIDFNNSPLLEIDIVIATSCSKLSVRLSDSSQQLFAVDETFKKSPTRFEFTEKERQYWTELKRMHGALSSDRATSFSRLDKVAFVRKAVEEGLKLEADNKQEQEENARKLSNIDTDSRSAVFLIANGVGILHIVSQDADDNSDACRLHGRAEISKGKTGNLVLSVGSGLRWSGFTDPSRSLNSSHRIERLNFGSNVHGILSPLTGVEQISAEGDAEYHYFVNVVPTKIFNGGVFGGYKLIYQYSVTFMQKARNDSSARSHPHSGVAIHYEFAPTVIEMHRKSISPLQVLFRMCSAVGGIFATSSLINLCIDFVLTKFKQSNDDNVLPKRRNVRENLIVSMFSSF